MIFELTFVGLPGKLANRDTTRGAQKFQNIYV